jgi:hypothetical protein
MTCYCSQVNWLSKNLWEYLSDVFRYQLPAAEIGITNHFIYDITEFYSGFGILCEVYKLHAKHEKYRGADIDLFIQNPKGAYQHYMLQAKVMDYKGYYNDIPKWSSSAQFVTLVKAAKKENALSLYLLYNGLTRKSTLSNKNLGLSIIEANEIRKFRLNQRRNGYVHGQHSLFFDLLYHLMQPYSNLFCKGKNNIDLPPSKNYIEIFTEFPYIRIFPIANQIDEDNDYIENFGQIEQTIRNRHLAPIRIILKNQELNQA